MNSPLHSPFPGTFMSVVQVCFVGCLTGYLFIRTSFSVVINWTKRTRQYKFLTNIFVALIAAYIFMRTVLGLISYYMGRWPR